MALVLLAAYYFSLPKTLFVDDYATVIESAEGKLLGAKIATDGQWRFPEMDSVPYKYEVATRYFEDEYFYYHWGINPISTVKAFWQNSTQGRVVRGGSTLTQQVIRLSRNNPKRTYAEKIIELILATRLEFRYSKKHILALYASHAPFGGNVVGLEMASWRYFGVAPERLSWGQSATLAVLPNAPSLIFPGKNQDRLKEKRNRLLKKLFDNQIIDKETYELALAEPLPQKPNDLPQTAPHLVERIAQESRGKRIKTNLQLALQEKVNDIVKNYYHSYSQSEVYNMAVLVIDTKTRNILSYVGNSPTDENHQKDVDIIQAPRSTGSILKPFLYAAMLNEVELLPQMMVPDIPTQISGYSPKNFDNTFEGAVPADEALAKSLNIPFVLLLQRYGVYRFYDILQKLGLKTINKHPDHYGLSLILGGAESTLWDMSQAYTNLASKLRFFNETQQYRTHEFQPISYTYTYENNFGKITTEKQGFGAGTLWATFQAMKEVNRPTDDAAWRYYASSQKIAWKTGTSFGNKDAWAIGVTPEYVVGVWVGNATGEGRPTLTGASFAAPVLFSVFNILPRTSWFATPYDDVISATVCQQSGYLANPNCPMTETLTPNSVKEGEPCPYHSILHLNKEETFQVNTSCESVENITNKSWFILPPVMEWYYKKTHINYRKTPPLRPDCVPSHSQKGIDFIYPKHQSIIYLAKDFDGKTQPFIAQVANSEGNVFWYLNHTFLGTTEHFHEIQIYPPKGNNTLKVINSKGDERTIVITIK